MSGKSLLTNTVCLLLIAAGWFLPIPSFYGDMILSAGLFGFSGAITNWLAVKMIFEKIPFFYGSGVVILKFEEIKKGILRVLMDNLFNDDTLRNLKEKTIGKDPVDLTPILQNSNSDLDLDMIFDEVKEIVMSSSLGQTLGMFGGESLVEQFRPEFKTKVRAKLPQLFSHIDFSKILAESFPEEKLKEKIESVIHQRLEELSPENVREIVENMIREHLGWLVVWGGVFGGLIGIVGAQIL